LQSHKPLHSAGYSWDTVTSTCNLHVITTYHLICAIPVLYICRYVTHA